MTSSAIVSSGQLAPTEFADAETDQVSLSWLIESHAEARPDKAAVRLGEAVWSYRDLVGRANQLAHQLRVGGIGRGSRIVVCSSPNTHVAAALIAVQKLGAVYVPIGFDYPKSRVQTIVDELKPDIILAAGSSADLFEENGDILKDLDTFGQDAPKDLPDIEPAPATPDDIAYIFYTSGTTGTPKGIAVSYRGLAFYVMAAIKKYRIDANEIQASIAKYSFSISLFELLCPLVAGGTLVMLERDTIMNAASLAAELEKVTFVHIGPSLFRRTLAHIREHYDGVERFAGLRHVSVGGDVAQPDLLEELKRVFQNAEVYVIYGCTEIACMGCTYFVPRDRIVDKTYVGKAFEGMNVILLGEDEQKVAEGEKGEVCFAGAGLLSEYINKPELLEEKLIDIDGRTYFRTGDVGRFNASGQLELLGRRDFQIKLRGLRIEPVEVETHLRKAPGVQDAVVGAVEADDQEKRLVGYIVPDGRNASVRDIRNYLGTYLPDYMVPSVIVRLDRLPLNQNLKVDRNALPAPTGQNMLTDGGIVPPRNDVEKRLAAIWRAELHLKSVGVTSSFFDLGGDSLMAINVLMEVENTFGVALSNDVFLQTSTIEGLARVINGDLKIEPRDDIVPLREGRGGPPIFCLFGILTYRDFAAHLDMDRSVLCVAPKEEDAAFFKGDIDAIKAIFSDLDGVAERYLKIVTDRQPSGPYVLGGHSWGGVLALEVAKKLKARGEQIDLVILYDAYEPMYARKAFQSRRLKQGLRSPLQLSRKLVRRLLPFGRSLDDKKTGHRSHRWQAKRHSSDNYRPTVCDLPIVMFRAGDQSAFGIFDPKLGWGDNLTNAEIVEIPGDHHGILEAPNVRGITDYVINRLG